MALGYVDHPPLSIALLALVRGLCGDGLVALRLLPAFLGAAVVFATGRLAREFGGGRFAGLVAGLTAVFTTYLGLCHFYSMNALDLAFWALAFCMLPPLLRHPSTPRWIALGVVLGFGLQNKVSVLFLGAGLFVALSATPHRRLLATRGPWLAAGTAALIFLPHVLWQWQNGWPTAEFVRNAKEHKLLVVTPLHFALGQLMSMNPLHAPFWGAGLLALCFWRALREARVFAWIFVTVTAILILSGDSKPYYLAAAYPPLLAAGGVVCERLLGGGRLRWLRPVLVVLLLGLGAVMAPLALPLLEPQAYTRYAEALGVQPAPTERHAPSVLPQHFADQFGWAEIVAAVEQVYATLTPAEQAQCLVFGQNYGEAGAVDVLGRRRGLPPAISGHNSYFMWGVPAERSGEVLIIIGGRREDHERSYAEVTAVTSATSRWAMPDEQDLTLYLARQPRASVAELWPFVKHYD